MQRRVSRSRDLLRMLDVVLFVLGLGVLGLEPKLLQDAAGVQEVPYAVDA